MAFHVFFAFSTGLKEPLLVPKGTLERIQNHVQQVETTLHLEKRQYLDNPPHWDPWQPRFEGVEDKTLCETISEHNQFVRGLYHRFAEWSKEPVTDGETLTPEDAKTFWYGLELLTVPLGRWTPAYYVEQMEVCYEVLRGRESEGMTFEAAALTPKQAAAVINLFSFLDTDDRRLEVPKGTDYLASSYDGGYDWCEMCHAAIDDYGRDQCRRKKCPLREEEG